MDQKKSDEFAERVIGEINSAMSCLNLYIGHRLDLFKAVVEVQPVTSRNLAKKTGLNERYLREWLECMTASGYFEHDEKKGSFSIPIEHAIPLLEKENPNYVGAFICWIPSLSGILEPLMQGFRTGEGVPYEAYGSDTLEAVGMGNRPMFINDYVSKWIPHLPDIMIKLEKGGRVADIGCGVGWSSISLAKGFPKIKIDAYDLDDESIKLAKENAKAAGVEDKITFHKMAAEDIYVEEPYDLVTAFECIHDMAYPVRALEKMKEMVSSDGAVLISDEAAGENIKENSNFFGSFLYNFSVLHCLPQAMVFPGSAQTGTVMSNSDFSKYAKSAGFSKIDVLPIENPFWRFYRLGP
jgi:2-polyprenyl-3-methyl-5-hydroxy-6-metoxy-1,4-benzoquinol methylase